MHSELLRFALKVAEAGGDIARAYYQQNPTVETKADASPVTAADLAAERVMRELIRSRFPSDGILGEEFGGEHEGAARRWIIDPIDGTRAFVRGVPLFGCLVALEAEGVANIGVIHLPALGETVFAERGAGCWWNERRVHVSETAHLEQAVVLTTDVANIEKYGVASGWHQLTQRAGAVRTWGDCYGHALVATGRADVMLDPIMSIWDAAALQPIIEEAGGVFTDIHGKHTHDGGSALATNAALADEVRRLLRGEAP